jgi:Trp operon repressor
MKKIISPKLRSQGAQREPVRTLAAAKAATIARGARRLPKRPIHPRRTEEEDFSQREIDNLRSTWDRPLVR